MGRPDFRPPESRTPEYPPYDWPPRAVVPGIANPGRRLVARLIDITIMTVTVFVLAIPFIVVADENPESANWVIAPIILIAFCGFYLYDPIQLALWGRTPGKRVMKLRVAAADAPDAPLSGARGFGRGMAYPLLFSVIGLFPLLGLVSLLNALWLLWDVPLRQCLHDKIAGTVVMNTPAVM